MKIKHLLLSFVILCGFAASSFAAAATPSNVRRHSMGSLSLVTADFPDTTDDTNTWASGLTGIVSYWAQDTDNPTTQGSVGTAVTQSAGTFTFYPAEEEKSFTLFVLCAR